MNPLEIILLLKKHGRRLKQTHFRNANSKSFAYTTRWMDVYNNVTAS